VAIKKVEGGVFSTYANQKLKAGDNLEVMQPVGKFYTELNPSQKKNYLAFAAGSGITPVISIINTTLRTEPQSQFTLVFGNRNKSSIIFKEELEALKDKYIDRFRIYHILSREQTDIPLNTGRIDVNKLIELNKLIDYNKIDEFFICGPEEMIFSVKEYLEQKDVDRRRIHFELFTTPGQENRQYAIGNRQFAMGNRQQAIGNEEKSKVSVKMDGIMFDFDLGYNSHSILEAGLQQGADLPFACKGGVCTSCKARLVEGKVAMDVHWGLEPEEIEQGYILTCQSHPVTDRVVVDYDAK
jgi:ring-1,2-phenylacetyl-CoA epoxidase subunit PaaE